MDPYPQRRIIITCRLLETAHLFYHIVQHAGEGREVGDERAAYLAEDAQLRRLVLGRQGQIGLLPLAPDAIALELLALRVHCGEREVTSFAPELDGRETPPLLVTQNLQYLR
jgi:hypothetical protein